MQAKHLRDKLGKLLIFAFVDGAGPAVLTDLMLLFHKAGMKSGLSGSVLDMSDSSQNNKRAQEMASVKVCRLNSY